MATMTKPEPMSGLQGTRAVAEKARDAATDLASSAKSVAKEQVEDRVNDTKARAVAGLGDVAGALRRTGDDSDNELLSDYVGRAADGLEQVSEYFRTKDVSAIVTDVERFARREPAIFIGGAFALGLLGARFLKSSSRADLELDEGEFVSSSPMRTASIPRPSPMRDTPRPIEPTRTTNPFPRPGIGVFDPSKQRGGGGTGSL